MYVCIYIYNMYRYIYTHMYICTDMYMYESIYVYMVTCLCMYTSTLSRMHSKGFSLDGRSLEGAQASYRESLDLDPHLCLPCVGEVEAWASFLCRI